MKRSPANLLLQGMDIQTEQDLERRVGNSYLAVGTTLLYSNPSFTPSAHRTLELLKNRQPIARTMTYFIYDFTDHPSPGPTP
jgi:hypothetical protein